MSKPNRTAGKTIRQVAKTDKAWRDAGKPEGGTRHGSRRSRANAAARGRSRSRGVRNAEHAAG